MTGVFVIRQCSKRTAGAIYSQIRMDQDNGLRQDIRNLLAAGGIRHGHFLLPLTTAIQ